jgi:two-component system OmpR family response regulator
MKKRILLVDDDESVRESLARVLSQASYLVVSVADGQQALAVAASTEIDLVLLDLNLPG